MSIKQVLIIMLCAAISFTGCKSSKEVKNTTATVAADDKEIHWMTIDEVQVAMNKEPKKVFMDVYTDWCGWCKVMDKKTFTNKDVIKYINANFYAVKFNAEVKEMIRFKGKVYNYTDRANDLAVELLHGQLTYPTSIVMEENFQNPQPLQGYLDVPTLETVLKYVNEGHYKTTPFEQWQKEYKPVWAN